jgi:predicted adenine nucleotide alpha hydrolase (AANH) superfamily ATPase
MADAMAPDEQRWTGENAPEEEADDLFASRGGEAVLPPAVNPVPWLRAVAGREKDRCPFCWRSRLGKCAATAARLGFAGFTTSLLYSRYQNHEAIRALGRELALATGLLFIYEDFRVDWRQGIALSREWGIYRQQYCGCLFSEYARYSRDLARLRDGGH